MGQFLIFLYYKFLQKRRCATKKIFKGPGSFDCLQQSTNLICGKHLVQTFSFAFVSKLEFPFQKAVFTKDIARVS